MHEIGLCEGVLAAVERRAAGRPVAAIRVQVGALLHVVPDAFQQSFALVAAGGVADGAATDVVVTPVTGRCRACDAPFSCMDPLPACPSCGSVALDRDGGEELVLESIEYRATHPVEG